MHTHTHLGWIWGDPHFNSVDGHQFTFNGIGEYTLLSSPTNQLTIQSRLIPFMNTDGTVLSAVAVNQGTVQTVQVEAQNSQLVLYIGGVQKAIPTGNTVYIVTDNGILDDVQGGLNVANPSSMSSSSNQIFVRSDSDALVITTPIGATLMVSIQESFLSIVTELSGSFMGTTRGLLGVFNGNPDDDFTTPDGTVLSSSSTEEEIYHQFGLQCT